MNEWIRLPSPIKDVAEQNTLFSLFGGHNMECRRVKVKVGSQNKHFFDTGCRMSQRKRRIAMRTSCNCEYALRVIAAGGRIETYPHQGRKILVDKNGTKLGGIRIDTLRKIKSIQKEATS